MLAPTTAGFLLMWICIILIMFRGNKVRTYNVALFLEVAIIGLWVSLSGGTDLSRASLVSSGSSDES